MAKHSCGTCRHYQNQKFDLLMGYCHWLEAYPGMKPELPMWAIRGHPYPVYPLEGAKCPQWQEALP